MKNRAPCLAAGAPNAEFWRKFVRQQQAGQLDKIGAAGKKFAMMQTKRHVRDDGTCLGDFISECYLLGRRAHNVRPYRVRMRGKRPVVYRNMTCRERSISGLRAGIKIPVGPRNAPAGAVTVPGPCGG